MYNLNELNFQFWMSSELSKIMQYVCVSQNYDIRLLITRYYN